MKKDSLGNRMKSNYEDITRFYLPRRTHVIIRVDGKAFHTITKNMDRPFDMPFLSAMQKTMRSVCQEMQGVEFAYTQSDEISFLLTDFKKITTQAWFDNNLQKMCSISASLTTYYFNKYLMYEDISGPIVFDSRVFTISDSVEVENYFIWRQQDAVRNSIQSLAQSYYSHKELHGKNASQLQDMIHDKGDNWNDYPVSLKRGVISRKVQLYDDQYIDKESKFMYDVSTPIFTQDRRYLRNLIPTRED